MSELKYKVGDSVQIKSIDWYEKNKSKSHGTVACGDKYFDYDMREWCGKIMTILTAYQTCYIMKEDGAKDLWTDEMIECKVEAEPKFKVGDSVEVLKSGNTYTISQMKFNGKEFIYKLSNNDSTVCWFSEEELKPIHFINIAIKPHNVRGDVIIKMLEELGGTNAFSFDGSDHNCVNPFAYYIDNDDKQIYSGGIEFLRKNGYKIYALEELKKKEYPKTYDECSVINGCDNRIPLKIIGEFTKLINARNAYWRIAGQEMGLGKRWEPDWREKRYIIYRNQDDIIGGYREAGCLEHHILAFPTPEMRDAFKENFKEEIEFCKELL